MVDAGRLGAGVAGGPIGRIALRRDVDARWPIQQLGICSASQRHPQSSLKAFQEVQGTGPRLSDKRVENIS